LGDDIAILPVEADGSLEGIYRDVLMPAFTSDELEPLEALRGYLRSDPPAAFGWYALGPSGPLGCCIYYRYPEANALLLGYMAVAADERSRGIGTRLFEESRQAWCGSEEYDLVLTELEDPRVFSVGSGIDPERRVKFYSRVSGSLICGPYFAPCVRSGGKRVHDMFLVLLGGSARAVRSSPAGVSGESVAEFLREYFSVETDVEESDRVDLSWLLENYEREPTVPLIPLADYRSWDAPRAPSRRRG
jgi:hypothetical protein